MNMTHNKAILLENILRNVYDCDRYGLAGLADADGLERYPYNAAIVIIALIYSKYHESELEEIKEFGDRYSFDIQRHLDELDEEFIDNYIDDLRAMVKKYLHK